MAGKASECHEDRPTDRSLSAAAHLDTAHTPAALRVSGRARQIPQYDSGCFTVKLIFRVVGLTQGGWIIIRIRRNPFVSQIFAVFEETAAQLDYPGPSIRTPSPRSSAVWWWSHSSSRRSNNNNNRWLFRERCKKCGHTIYRISRSGIVAVVLWQSGDKSAISDRMICENHLE